MKMIFTADEIEVFKQTAKELSMEDIPKDLNGFFQILDEDDSIFGEKETPNLRTAYFMFLWKVVEKRVSDAIGRECFLEDALSPFRDAFLDTISGLWYDPAKETAEEICGEIPFPYQEWLEGKLMPQVMSGRHFHDMALKYPVLGIQAPVVTRAFAEHIKEVLKAIADNKELVIAHGKVREVSASESDWHDHARSVHVITFSDGEKMIYKPHSMSIDRAFGRWLDKLCDYAMMERFPLPKSFDSEKGAFCSFIEHTPLLRGSDASMYFYRMGFLMGAVYIIGGYDMHAENIIACKAFPLPVDLETIILPPDCILARMNTASSQKSIDSAGFLPMLASPPGLVPSGVDSLTSRFEGSYNLPFCGDVIFRGSDFANEVIKGFLKLFDTVAENQNELKEFFTDTFDGANIRLVLRATSNYLRLLNHLEMADNLRNVEKYRLVSSKLSVASELLSEKEQRVILSEERAALLRLDVPRFDITLKRDSLAGIWDDIKGKDCSFAQKQADIIRFALSGIRADDGKNVTGYIEKVPCEDALLPLTESLMEFLEGRTVPILEASRDKRYYYGNSIGKSPYLMEGGLGAYIALGSYAAAYKDQKLHKYLEKKAEMFTDIHNLGLGMSLRAVGLADGVGGLIRGLCMGYELELFSKEAVKPIFKAIYDDVLKVSRIRFLTEGFLHGAGGLLYSMEKIPVEFRSDNHNEIIEALKVKQGNTVFDRLPLEIKDDLSGNNTLFYGNAGILYSMSFEDGRGSKKSFSKEELLNVLLRAKAPIEGVDAPNGYTFTGFFSGMSGILYALSKNEAPCIIPEI